MEIGINYASVMQFHLLRRVIVLVEFVIVHVLPASDRKIHNVAVLQVTT